MSRALYVFGAVFAVLFLVVAIAEGIGQPSVPSGDVALVQDVPGEAGKISEADFEHALQLAAAQAHVKKVPQPGEAKYEELKTTALNSLFDVAWIEGLAAEMGKSATPQQVAAELKKLKAQNFKTEAAYKKFLKESHFTPEDVNQRVKLQILSTEIQKEITEGAPKPSEGEAKDYYEEAKATQFTTPAVKAMKKTKTTPAVKAKPAHVESFSEVKSQIESTLTQQAQQEAFAKFIANYQSTWRNRTFCASGYTVERCSNFKGSGHPAMAPPACYEAHPKAPAEACPAPVFQLVPALPGSVSVVERRGRPMPQRPQPAGLKPAATTELPPGGVPGGVPTAP